MKKTADGLPQLETIEPTSTKGKHKLNLEEEPISKRRSVVKEGNLKAISVEAIL